MKSDFFYALKYLHKIGKVVFKNTLAHNKVIPNNKLESEV